MSQSSSALTESLPSRSAELRSFSTRVLLAPSSGMQDAAAQNVVSENGTARAAKARSSRLRARIMHRALGLAFTGVWIVLPLLPLSAIAMWWLSGL